MHIFNQLQLHACNSNTSILTQFSSIEQIIIISNGLQQNLIQSNCVIVLTHYNNVLTYLFLHIPSHSFQQSQTHNTWTILIQFTQPGTDFNSPETQQWAVHGQPTCPTSVSLFGTEFLTHLRSYKHQSIIYCINSNLTAHISFWASRIVPNVQKNFHNSVPCFGTDQQPIPGIFPYQACILMQNFHRAAH